MKWALVIAVTLLAISPRAELTRDSAFDMLINASLYQTKCHGYVSPSAEVALNRLGDKFDIKLSDEIDASKAIDRMERRSLEIEQRPGALAVFCARVRNLRSRNWIRRDGSFKRLLNPADGVNALKNARPPLPVIAQKFDDLIRDGRK